MHWKEVLVISVLFLLPLVPLSVSSVDAAPVDDVVVLAISTTSNDNFWHTNTYQLNVIYKGNDRFQSEQLYSGSSDLVQFSPYIVKTNDDIYVYWGIYNSGSESWKRWRFSDSSVSSVAKYTGGDSVGVHTWYDGPLNNGVLKPDTNWQFTWDDLNPITARDLRKLNGATVTVYDRNTYSEDPSPGYRFSFPGPSHSFLATFNSNGYYRTLRLFESPHHDNLASTEWEEQTSLQFTDTDRISMVWDMKSLAADANIPLPTVDVAGVITGIEGAPVTLSATASTVNKYPTYQWDFNGDGTWDRTTVVPQPTGPIVVNPGGPGAWDLHTTISSTTYAWPDDFLGQLRVRVTDSYGQTTVDTAAVSITNAAPGVEAGANREAEIGLPFTLTGTFSDSGIGDSHTATWNWGDESTSAGTVSGKTVTGTHTYTTAGAFTATLTVTDDNGGTGSDTVPVTVTAPPPPVFLDTFDDNVINESFWRTDQVGGPTVAESGSRIEYCIPSESAGSSFSSRIASNRILRGDFDVQVDYRLLEWPAQNGVRLGLGTASGTIERVSFSLTDSYPVGEAYFTDLGGARTRLATAHMDGKLRLLRKGSTITGYSYDSGQWTAISTNPVSVPDVGITLGVWSHDYCFSDKPVKVAIDNFSVNKGNFVLVAPQASFTANVTSGSAPLPVKFTDTSTESPTSWSWDFGDGATSTEQHPVHTYETSGIYTVNLTVANDAGSDSEVKTNYVTTPIGGDHGYFLVSTEPAGADIYLEYLGGDRVLKGNTSAGSLNVTVMLVAAPVKKVVANLSGYRDAVWNVTEYPPRDGVLPVHLVLDRVPVMVTIPDGTGIPTDTNGDGLYDDVNGNGRKDFADVVLYFNQMAWIGSHEPVPAFDYNGNGRIDFADVVWLFNRL